MGEKEHSNHGAAPGQMREVGVAECPPLAEALPGTIHLPLPLPPWVLPLKELGDLGREKGEAGGAYWATGRG